MVRFDHTAFDGIDHALGEGESSDISCETYRMMLLSRREIVRLNNRFMDYRGV